MKTKQWKNRPKWAKPLDARLWKHLCEAAFNPLSPTLAGVKRNLQGQREQGIVCHDCNSIAVRLGLEVR